MAKWEATPFVVRHSLVIEGGWLSTPWVLNTKVIDGGEFYTMKIGDRSLAKALGMNLSERSPLAKCSIFPYMAEARDTKVDGLIFAAKVDNDPMADASASGSSAKMPSKGRTAALASVPSTISIDMPAFVTADGQRVEGHTLRVVATPKRGAAVTMEVTAENFEWLAKAAQAEWEVDRKPAQKRTIDCFDDGSWPELQHPCKYWKTSAGKLKIMCYYFHEGRWKRHTKALNVSTDLSSLESIVRSCENDVLEFYNLNHQPHDEEHPEAAPLTMC